MPIAYMTSSFVNMLLSFLVVFAVLIVTGYGVNPVAMLYLPIIMIVEYILGLGIALLTSALTVYLRDLAYILSIIAMACSFDTSYVFAGDGAGRTGILSDAGAHLESEPDDAGYQCVQGYPVL